MKMTALKPLLAAIQDGNHLNAVKEIDALLVHETGTGWIRDMSKLRAFLIDGTPRFSIMALKGNIKEPFVSFSSLAGAGFCAGAGECLKFCYSFKAWRYPAAFCRQVQNTILLDSIEGRHLISCSLSKATKGKETTFRLYVDGDFRNLSDVKFWMEALKAMPHVSAYGYSKSFEEFLSYSESNTFPDNYILNISGGHRHTLELVEQMKGLPITRGEFVAVRVPHKVTSAMHGDRSHQKVLRETYGRKSFTCGGKCGECTPVGHACGSRAFQNVDIIIAVH
jgi:hypothetical protein